MADHPHDVLFKKTFGHPRHAAAELRSVLPAALVEQIDWSSLAPDTSEVATRGHVSISVDLLYRARFVGGGEVFVHLILEHQSTVNRLMPLRFLEYMLAVWRRHVARYGQGAELPPIVPVLLHHGKGRWNAAVAFEELFGLSPSQLEAVRPFVPCFRMALDDLSAQSHEALRTRPMDVRARVTLWVLASVRAGAFFEQMPAWRPELQELFEAEEAEAALEAILSYILHVAEYSAEHLQERFTEVVGPHAKDAIMTAAERLIEQGIKKGIKKGREQGIESGQRALLKRQLELKFGNLSEEVDSRLAAADPSLLEKWAECVLSAESLDDVFGT